MIHAYIHKYNEDIRRLDDSLNENVIQLYSIYEEFSWKNIDIIFIGEMNP